MLGRLLLVACLVLGATGCAIPPARPLWAQEVRRREAEYYRLEADQRAARLWLTQYRLMARDLDDGAAGVRDGLARCPTGSGPAGSALVAGVAVRAQADLDQAPVLPERVRADRALLEAARRLELATSWLGEAVATGDASRCAAASAALEQFDRSFADAAAASAAVAAHS
jgi:hypothetical protein